MLDFMIFEMFIEIHEKEAPKTFYKIWISLYVPVRSTVLFLFFVISYDT